MTTGEWTALGEFWQGILAAIGSMGPSLRISSAGLVAVRVEAREHANVQACDAHLLSRAAYPYDMGVVTGKRMRAELEAARKPVCWASGEEP